MDQAKKNELRAALCQTEIIWEDKSRNILHAKQLITEAVRNGAQLILFPEMSFTGFSMDIEKTKEADMRTVKQMGKCASEYGVFIGFGWVKTSENKGENHYTIIDQNGIMVLDYIKLHPFQYGGEGKQFVPGSKVYDCRIYSFCFTPFICYDLRFPEIFRMKLKETDAYIVPANWPASRNEHWNVLLRARAIENQSYVLGINCVGKIGGIVYSGDTCVIDPNGEVIEHISGKEEILYVNLKKDALKIRDTFPVRQDRRPALYYV